MAKVTVYLNNEVWSNFKAQVFKKHGTLRQLSYEVENTLRNATVADQIASAFENMSVTTKRISPQEIKSKRPKSKGPPSEELVKELRQKRLAQTLS